MLLSRPLRARRQSTATRLAESTLKRPRRRLEDEHGLLTVIIPEFDTQRQVSLLAGMGLEDDAEPENSDGGSPAFEMEMDLSIEQNAKDLVERIEHALDIMDSGECGICEVSGKPIPIAGPDVLIYATVRAEYAARV
jgi:RNA polymerase-binding transcription factor DksA